MSLAWYLTALEAVLMVILYNRNSFNDRLNVLGHVPLLAKDVLVSAMWDGAIEDRDSNSGHTCSHYNKVLSWGLACCCFLLPVVRTIVAAVGSDVLSRSRRFLGVPFIAVSDEVSVFSLVPVRPIRPAGQASQLWLLPQYHVHFDDSRLTPPRAAAPVRPPKSGPGVRHLRFRRLYRGGDWHANRDLGALHFHGSARTKLGSCTISRSYFSVYAV